MTETGENLEPHLGDEDGDHRGGELGRRGAGGHEGGARHVRGQAQRVRHAGQRRHEVVVTHHRQPCAGKYYFKIR